MSKVDVALRTTSKEWTSKLIAMMVVEVLAHQMKEETEMEAEETEVTVTMTMVVARTTLISETTVSECQ